MVKRATTFLFPAFSFKSGAASCCDLSGQFYFCNQSENPEEADMFAQMADWQAVKSDFDKAVSQFKKEIDQSEFR